MLPGVEHAICTQEIARVTRTLWRHVEMWSLEDFVYRSKRSRLGECRIESPPYAGNVAVRITFSKHFIFCVLAFRLIECSCRLLLPSP